MLHNEFIRVALLLVPAGYLTWRFTQRTDGVRFWAGALLTWLWQFQLRLLLYAGGIQAGIWQFTVPSPGLYGVPVDAVIGISLLSGPVLMVCTPRLPPPVAGLADVLLVVLLLPVQTSGPQAYAGLLAVSLLAVVPANLLARWTATDRHLYARALLQPVVWAMLLLWLFPALVFEATADSWDVLLARPWRTTALLALPLLIPVLLLAGALYEFAVQGRGTAFPYDPPRHLVTTGIYRHLSNPMQAGIVLLTGGWGLLCGSAWIVLAAGMAVVLFMVFRNVCNGSCALVATDPNWAHYQRTVRKWIPRLTPYQPPDTAAAAHDIRRASR